MVQVNFRANITVLE